MKRQNQHARRAASFKPRGYDGWYAKRKFNRAFEYREGQGVPADPAEAFRLTAEAARAGHHAAVLNMGWYYLDGIGVEADIDQARSWYRKSARQGDPRAMLGLAIIEMEAGRFDLAAEWLRRAIAEDHADARFVLGKLYWRGRGVPMDRKLAMVLFTEAARAKVPEAQRVIRFFTYLKKRARRR
ncbi:MAG TPA: tetratricopeptide repeat protein [Polyangia bacterium]|jgi:localization factor PodJL